MRISFLELDAAVPDGWTDESTLIYSMPEAPLGPPLLTRNQVQRHAPASLAITWERGARISAQRYLDDRLKQLVSALRGLRVTARGEAGQTDDPIPFAEFELELTTPLTQLLAVRRVGPHLLCVTGTARPAVYPGVREMFLAAARSVRESSGPS